MSEDPPAHAPGSATPRRFGRKGFIGIAGVMGAAAVAGVVAGAPSPPAPASAEDEPQAIVVRPGQSGDDDAVAIRAAVRSLPSGGGLVALAPGHFHLRTPVDLGDGVALRGASTASTVLVVPSEATADTLRLRAASTLSDLTITVVGAARTRGAHVAVTGNESSVQRCTFTGYHLGVVIGSTDDPVVGTLITDSVFRSASTSAGSGAIDARGFANAVVAGTMITGLKGAGQQPDFGIRIGRGDTLLISDTNVTSHGIALDVAPPAGEECTALQAVNSLFDSAGLGTDRTLPSARIVPVGRVYNTLFSNCWFGLATGSGCVLGASASGEVVGVSFTGCQFVGNIRDGLTIASPAVTSWTVTGGSASGNRGAGIRVATTAAGFTISGFAAGGPGGANALNARRGPNGNGIVIADGSDRYVVSGCQLTGNDGPGLVAPADTASRSTFGTIG